MILHMVSDSGLVGELSFFFAVGENKQKLEKWEGPSGASSEHPKTNKNKTMTEMRDNLGQQTNKNDKKLYLPSPQTKTKK